MRISLASVLSLMILALLAACATEAPKIRSPIEPERLTPYLDTGPNSVAGQAFIKQKDGSVITCAGSGVLLLPDTPYFREVLDHIAHHTMTFEESKINEYAKQSQCDAQGNFVFERVPKGAWLVVTSVTWEDKGGLLIRPLTLPTTLHKVIMTGTDLVK